MHLLWQDPRCRDRCACDNERRQYLKLVCRWLRSLWEECGRGYTEAAEQGVRSSIDLGSTPTEYTLATHHPAGAQ